MNKSPDAMSLLGAYILAVISAVANGSWAALRKLRSVQDCRPTTLEFNMYMNIGVFISSLLMIIVIPFTGKVVGLCWQGLLAGVLLAVATTCSFLAVANAGVSIGQGVWCSTAVLVSFLWGTFGPEEIADEAKSVPISITSVVIIILGVVGIVYSLRLSTAPRENEQEELNEEGNAALGIMFAVLSGSAGGTILVPMAFAPSSMQNVAFLPSLGLGAFVAAMLFHRIASCISVREEVAYEQVTVDHLRSRFKTNAAIHWGIASGFIWNVGNICAIYAMETGLSYGVAYPILQCALVVSGILGIVVFQEVKGGKSISCFTISTLLVIVGIFLLGAYGPQKPH